MFRKAAEKENADGQSRLLYSPQALLAKHIRATASMTVSYNVSKGVEKVLGRVAAV